MIDRSSGIFKKMPIGMQAAARSTQVRVPLEEDHFAW
jgi:hypothetical protein